MKKLPLICCTVGVITLVSCERRGDWGEPYEAKESAFTTPNDGNRSGYPEPGLQPSDAPGGATSPGVTAGGPSTMLDEGAGVPPMPPEANPEQAADSGENESNAAGATAPGGGSSSAPTAGGNGTPQDAKGQGENQNQGQAPGQNPSQEQQPQKPGQPQQQGQPQPQAPAQEKANENEKAK